MILKEKNKSKPFIVEAGFNLELSNKRALSSPTVSAKVTKTSKISTKAPKAETDSDVKDPPEALQQTTQGDITSQTYLSQADIGKDWFSVTTSHKGEGGSCLSKQSSSNKTGQW